MNYSDWPLVDLTDGTLGPPNRMMHLQSEDNSYGDCAIRLSHLSKLQYILFLCIFLSIHGNKAIAYRWIHFVVLRELHLYPIMTIIVFYDNFTKTVNSRYAANGVQQHTWVRICDNRDFRATWHRVFIVIVSGGSCRSSSKGGGCPLWVGQAAAAGKFTKLKCFHNVAITMA